MEKVSIQSLLEAGAHFGHQTRRWNPKMKPYIFGSRGDIYIIDLKQTLLGMDEVYSFVRNLASNGGTVLFVGTKKQAQESIAEAANSCGMPYVNARWLGGMLTNFVTIRSRVKRMEELEAMDADGRMAQLPKKEQILLHKELTKLQTNLNGIRNMTRVPDAIFVVDTNRELISIREAQRLNIPVVGTLDTNCDPDDVDYPMPANDDAIRSVRLLCDFVAAAVIEGLGAPVTAEEMAAQEAPAVEAQPAAPEVETFTATTTEAPRAAAVTSIAAEETPAEEAAEETTEEAPAAEEEAPAAEEAAEQATEAAEETTAEIAENTDAE